MVLTAFLILAASPVCEAPAASSLPRDLDKALKAVVLIRTEKGIGSGVIISGRGDIITANHVVSGATEVAVELNSGESLQASVIDGVPSEDLAWLKVQLSRSSCLQLASELPRVGSELYAVGSPLDEALSQTVSRGIVSAVRRGDGFELIQTDASLNPGNSGGPLLDARGRVAAIVSFKISAEGIEGLAFGVPSRGALRLISNLPKPSDIPREVVEAQESELSPVTSRLREAGLLPERAQFPVGYEVRGALFVRMSDGQHHFVRAGLDVCATSGTATVCGEVTSVEPERFCIGDACFQDGEAESIVSY